MNFEAASLWVEKIPRVRTQMLPYVRTQMRMILTEVQRTEFGISIETLAIIYDGYVERRNKIIHIFMRLHEHSRML